MTSTKKAVSKLPLAAINAGVLYVNPGRFFLKKGDEFWTGAAGPEDRAYLEFRGPETSEGRKALRTYADVVGAIGDDAKTAGGEKRMLSSAIDLVEGMLISWRLFDGDGDVIDLKPSDVDPDLGKTQARLLFENWSETAPRKLIEIANFIRDLKNF